MLCTRGWSLKTPLPKMHDRSIKPKLRSSMLGVCMAAMPIEYGYRHSCCCCDAWHADKPESCWLIRKQIYIMH